MRTIDVPGQKWHLVEFADNGKFASEFATIEFSDITFTEINKELSIPAHKEVNAR